MLRTVLNVFLVLYLIFGALLFGAYFRVSKNSNAQISRAVYSIVITTEYG